MANKSLTKQIEYGVKKMTIIEVLLLQLGIFSSAVFIGGISGVVFGYDMTQVLYTVGTNTEITAAFGLAEGSLLAGYAYNIRQGRGGWYPNQTESLGLGLGGLLPALAFLNQATFNFFNQGPMYQAIFVSLTGIGMALVASQRYMAR